ncbi:hypothetical protein BGW80DRAFT_793462 [Lactifluus volemus]|nr:hypothetical protein BGW80DRAFT_793462 [Lactifluus volemus]
MPVQTSPPPASVTRLDLHDDVSENYEGFDRLRRGPSSHSHASHHHPGGHHHSQRRPHQHAFRQLNPAHDQGSFNQSAERTYYIIPPGMSVIFRDEHGNELKRVGDFSGTDDPEMYDETPIELTDRHGRTVYRTGGNYMDDAGVSDGTNGPKVVHLGQYISNSSGNGSVTSRSSSPLTVSLDRQGHHRRIHL